MQFNKFVVDTKDIMIFQRSGKTMINKLIFTQSYIAKELDNFKGSITINMLRIENVFITLIRICMKNRIWNQHKMRTASFQVEIHVKSLILQRAELK